MNTCNKCKHFTPWHKDDSGLPSGAGKYMRQMGKCALVGFVNVERGHTDHMVPDRGYTFDCEGYRTHMYVGKKFGCIHWQAKP